MLDVIVILPTKNEEECIGQVVKEIADLGLDLPVLVVDDSSNILTQEAALKAGKKYGVNLKWTCGVGNESPSIKKALLECKTGYVIVMDSDGSHPPSVIPEMIRFLEDGVSLVVGSRYVNGGGTLQGNGFSRAGNIFARFLLGMKTHDCTSRLFGCGCKLLVELSGWGGRGEDSIEVIYRAERMGLGVWEVPFVHRARMGGKSKTKVAKYIWVYFKRVLSLRLN